MKIALLNYTAYPFHGYGGAEKYIYLLATELIKQGHDVYILCTSYSKDAKIEKSVNYEHIKYVFFGRPFYGEFQLGASGVGERVSKIRGSKFQSLINLMRRIGFWSSVRLWVKQQNFDVVHSFSDTGFPIALDYQGAHVATIFDIENRGLTYKNALQLPYNKPSYYSYTTSTILRRAKLVTSGGIDNDRELNEIFHVRNDKIRLLSNAVELSKIPRLSGRERVNIRAKLGIQETHKVFLVFGRLEALKRPILAIKTFETYLKRSGQDACLIVIGSGPLAGEVRDHLKSIEVKFPRSRAIHLTNVPDAELYNILSIGNIALNFARTRYMLLAMMEVMACGVPVVSTEPLDGLVVNGANGLLTTDERAVCDIVVFMADDQLVNACSESAMKTVKNLTWMSSARQAEEIYHEVLEMTDNVTS